MFQKIASKSTDSDGDKTTQVNAFTAKKQFSRLICDLLMMWLCLAIIQRFDV